MTTKLTCPFEPTPELQSEDGVLLYLSNLSKLSRSDLYTELSNVMAAKHNQMRHPVGFLEREKKQALVTDLTDKVTVICISEFGHDAVSGFAGGDLKQLNEYIKHFDEQIAQQEDLEPVEHGAMLLRKLGEILVPKTQEDEDSELKALTDDTKYLLNPFNLTDEVAYELCVIFRSMCQGEPLPQSTKVLGTLKILSVGLNGINDHVDSGSVLPNGDNNGITIHTDYRKQLSQFYIDVGQAVLDGMALESGKTFANLTESESLHLHTQCGYTIARSVFQMSPDKLFKDTFPELRANT